MLHGKNRKSKHENQKTVHSPFAIAELLVDKHLAWEYNWSTMYNSTVTKPKYSRQLFTFV